ncbi:ABC transporter, partial [Enterococcus faecalis]
EFVNGNDEKMNTMLAGEDLPDLMTFDRDMPAAKEAAKFTLPLNKLAEKYDPYFLEHAAKPETLKWYTLEDGNIYGYPSFSTTTKDYESGGVQGDEVFIVRKDIYEKIGSPDMSTPQGFIDALKKAKEAQPKVDDGSDLVPFAATALDIANGGDGALGWVL